jgi:hypothetical protein
MAITPNRTDRTSNSNEISRLLTAAVVNANFRTLLLNDPARALAIGFNGETFRFTRGEHERILSIKARSLADFAEQLTDQHRSKAYRKPVHLNADRKVFLPIRID